MATDRTQVSQEEYVNGGKWNHCPVCGGDDIEGGGIDIDGNTATQLVGCADCLSEWYDVYTLTNYQLVEEKL